MYYFFWRNGWSECPGDFVLDVKIHFWVSLFYSCSIKTSSIHNFSSTVTISPKLRNSCAFCNLHWIGLLIRDKKYYRKKSKTLFSHCFAVGNRKKIQYGCKVVYSVYSVYIYIIGAHFYSVKMKKTIKNEYLQYTLLQWCRYNMPKFWVWYIVLQR